MDQLGQMLHSLASMGLPLLVAMVLHEYAHGWAAARCGDPTARLQGRLTLNPLAHIDPFGTIILPLLCLLLPGGFLLGWAKPVPVDPRNFREPRRDMALVAAAGPGMNLLLAVFSALGLTVLLSLAPDVRLNTADAAGSLTGFVLVPLAVMAYYSVLINVFLGLFNLLPIPPLDGGRILTCVLPGKPAMALARVEPYGMLILIGLIVFDKELRVIHTITSTFASGLSGTILSTALGLGPGIME
jgi:Zn-dependent protease